MTWGAIEPSDLGASRLRLDFGLRPVILRFNEWAVPGLGGAFFVRQLSWGCMGLRLASELDGSSSPSRVAEGLEAMASWIVVRQSKGHRVDNDMVQGKRKFVDVPSLSFAAVSRGNAYVTVPFRRAATRALPGLGFCQGEVRFNALSLTQQGMELAESAMADADARLRLLRWLKGETPEIRNVPDSLKKALLPQFATSSERQLVRQQLLAHPGRQAIRALLQLVSDERLAGVEGRKEFLDGLPDAVMRKQLKTCFAFEDLRVASLAAAQEVSNAIHDHPCTASALAACKTLREHFEVLADRALGLSRLLPDDAPLEAIAFCSEQGSSTSLATRILHLSARVPVIFSVIGDRIDQGIGYTRELVADDPFGVPEAETGKPLPVPKPLLRLRRLLTDAGERFEHAS